MTQWEAARDDPCRPTVPKIPTCPARADTARFLFRRACYSPDAAGRDRQHYPSSHSRARARRRVGSAHVSEPEYEYRGLVASTWDLGRGDTSGWSDAAFYRDLGFSGGRPRATTHREEAKSAKGREVFGFCKSHFFAQPSCPFAPSRCDFASRTPARTHLSAARSGRARPSAPGSPWRW